MFTTRFAWNISQIRESFFSAEQLSFAYMGCFLSFFHFCILLSQIIRFILCLLPSWSSHSFTLFYFLLFPAPHLHPIIKCLTTYFDRVAISWFYSITLVTLLCILPFCFRRRAPFNISYKARLVVMNSRKDFFLLHIWRIITAECSIIGWHFSYFSILSMSSHFLQACRVSAEKSADGWMWALLKVTILFFPGCL